MKNLINFFFSFDKLFKEKLVVPFFWLALIVWGLGFFATALASVQLGPLAAIVKFVNFFASILLALVSIRLVSEMFVAIFRINDNLSPDKGRSELVDIDPVAEARKAAEAAAARTRELTHSATEKTKATFDDVKHSAQDKTESLTSRVKTAATDASETAKERTERVMGKGSVPSASDDPTPVKILEPSSTTGSAPKRRGRPKGSKNKPKASTATATKAPAKRGPGRPKGSTAAKTTATAAPKRGRGRPKGSKNKTTAEKAAASTAPKRGRGRPKGSTNKPKTSAVGGPPRAKAPAKTGAKRGPKPGQKIPRDEFGNLLKKDGTPRKKPGPKKG